ncbi:papain-like cysteine protease C1 [Phytophthora cinnamomi]|uniref:papain-like cysteine protease C1 n=1 Tax=Phytophthora cinnamomi TaxID=4785 RepID=UPI003559F9AF|nr:papain-like cysteine protease C1 [Phytophthora cinnamomi]
MLPVSALSLGALALSTQFMPSSVVALSGDAQQIYTEWKQSSYYSQAVQVVNTVGGTAAGSFTSSTSSAKNGMPSSTSSAGDVNVGSLESNETITFPSSTSSAGSSATITSSSSSGSSTVVTTITETEEQQRFDQALAVIAELQSQHPHANFSINTPFALLTSEEFLAYVNRYTIDPASNPVKAGSSATTSTSSTAGMFTGDAGNSNGTATSSASGDIRTSSAASGETVDWQDAGCVTAVKDQGECDNGNVPSCSMSSCTEFDVGVTGYDSVRDDAGAIEDAVRKQPVSIFLYSGSSAFQYYSGGVLTGENCDKTGSHSALAVGFGETDDNVLYWRIKNQWGTSWGEDGYVRVERRYSGDSEGACGVEMYATWPTFDVSASSTSGSATSAPSVTTASPSVTTAAPSVTTSAPSVTTSAPSATTSAPSVTTAAPTSTPSATGAAATTVPSTTKAAVVTDTPSATETVQNTVDQSEPVASSSSNSGSAIQNETVGQVSDSSGSARLYESVTPEAGSASAVNEASNSSTSTPSPTTPSVVQSDSVAGDASYSVDATPSPTTPSAIQSDIVARDTSAPSTAKQDCAM